MTDEERKSMEQKAKALFGLLTIGGHVAVGVVDRLAPLTDTGKAVTWLAGVALTGKALRTVADAVALLNERPS